MYSVAVNVAKPNNQLATLMGCLMASPTVMREVSLTRDGLPSLAST